MLYHLLVAVVRSKLHILNVIMKNSAYLYLKQNKDKLVTIKDKAYYIVLILKYNNVNKQISLLCA